MITSSMPQALVVDRGAAEAAASSAGAAVAVMMTV